MTKLHRRYPGVNPFETAQAGQFFGRQRDVQDLCDLIFLEKLVVLFGKSGYGKSSLLNAGIVPKLNAPEASVNRLATPLVIKFASFTLDTTLTPIDAVITRLSLHLSDKTTEKELLELTAETGETLWSAFKARQKANPLCKYVLIFDQFEEFFTYPREQQVAFREQLAELLYTEIPQSLRDHWDDLDDETKTLLSEEMDIRAVFAIREDRLSWLNSLKNELPAILHNRYELKGLTEDQAKEAIRNPAKLQHTRTGPNETQATVFECHPFEYDATAEKTLLAELKKGGAEETETPWQEGRIEAFLLQICCENIESRLIEQARNGETKSIVGPEDLPRFDRIYEEYYNNKINELPKHQREVARHLIEDELISLNESTGVVFRLSADGRKLCSAPGVSEDLLKKLTNTFLLRSEPNTTGGFNYEISHDTLVPPVLKARELRLFEEKQREEERIKTEKEKELAAERKKRRRANIIAVAGISLAIIAFAASFFAFRLRQDAISAQHSAEKAQMEAELAQKTAEDRLQALQEEKARALTGRGDSYFQNDEYKLALEEYKKALELMPGDKILQEKIKNCELKLPAH